MTLVLRKRVGACLLRPSWNYLRENGPLARLNLMSASRVQVEEEDRKFFPPGCGLLGNSYNLPHDVTVSLVSEEFQD